MTHDDDVVRIVSRLSDATAPQPAGTFPDGQTDVEQPGLYAWWVDAEGSVLLSTPFDVALPPLIYAGQAGATSRNSGAVRKATLRSRIGGNHLKGSINSSTFRKTLTAILFEPLGLTLAGPGKLERESNQAVSAWIRDHLRIITVPCPDRATLADLEDDVLQRLDPPLNLMGMQSTPVRQHLKALRRRIS